MAPRIITSEPRVSTRNPKWYYCYYNDKSPSGTQCAVYVPNSLIGVVRRGFAFDDKVNIYFDEQLKGSVLTVDFDGAASPDSPVSPPKESGWADPDAHSSIGLAEPDTLRQVATRLGVTPEPPQLDPALENILEQLCLAYSFASKRLGCNERPRAMEIQKLLVTAAIPWLKDRGVKLTDDEEKAMSF